MKTMESELKRLDLQLYNAYTKSLKKATEEWLPNVVPKLDSYNSLPHILGVTKNVNMLLYNEEYGHAEIDLNSVELYILLNSILFHDIGKCNGNSNKKISHATESYKMIMRSWAVLGIESERMATIISRIAIFHDFDENQFSEKDIVKRIEEKTSVYSYGFVREKLLCALLFIADRLDSSYTRVVPDYISQQKEIVGDFRKHISSTYFDKYCKMVCTVIDKNSFCISDFDGKLDLEGVLRDHLEEYATKNREVSSEIRDESKVYILARDLYKNAKEIKIIKDELHIMRIPIDEWFLECNGYLFKVEKIERNCKTYYTTKHAIEPILDTDYCYDVFRAMIMLSVGVFNKDYPYYDVIANYIHEDIKDINKVKCAVRRLSLLNKWISRKTDYKIYCNDNVWQIEYKDNYIKDINNNHFDACYINKFIEARWRQISNLLNYNEE